MTNGSEYNEFLEYAEQFGNAEQEEANYYFTLNDFKDLVNKHGANRVLGDLDKEVEEKLYWYYIRPKLEKDKDDECPF